MVQTLAVPQLLVVDGEHVAEPAGLAQVERAAVDRAHLARRQQCGVRRGVGGCRDAEHVVVDRAAALAVEVEVRVVRDVERRGPVRGRDVVDPHLAG